MITLEIFRAVTPFITLLLLKMISRFGIIMENVCDGKVLRVINQGRKPKGPNRDKECDCAGNKKNGKD